MDKRKGCSLLEQESQGILIQEIDPGDTEIIDDCNGFNNLIQLAMLWMMRQFRPDISHFTLN